MSKVEEWDFPGNGGPLVVRAVSDLGGVMALTPSGRERRLFCIRDGRVEWSRTYRSLRGLCASRERVAVLTPGSLEVLDGGKRAFTAEGGVDMACSSDMGVIYIYNPLEETLGIVSEGEFVRDLGFLIEGPVLLSSSPDGRIPVGLSRFDPGLNLIFFNPFEMDVGKVFRLPPSSRLLRFFRPVVANDSTVAFSYSYSQSGRMRDVFVLYRKEIDVYLEAPFPRGFSYDLSDDGELLALGKRKDGLYLLRRGRPLWGFRGDVRKVALAGNKVVAGCRLGERFGELCIFDDTGAIELKTGPLLSFSISTDGKFLGYSTPGGSVRLLRIG
ncbi:hypothetical protein [Thermococcus sp.]|uniref:hypothetical protein n=1 Tax=Thermococcus sp. TaxID=35749 RepID=UPI0026101A3C|nr:hypothetical protein [Thermococcus sp.]